MRPKKHYKKGDIVYCRDGKEVKECIIVEVGKNNRSNDMYMLEVCDGSGRVIVTNESKFCDVSEMERQNAEIQETINAIWQDRCPDYDVAQIAEGIEKTEPAIPDDGELNEQKEYEMLYNAIGTIGAIVATLVEFADNEKKLGNAALLALRDRAESLGADDIRSAIDSYIESLAEDIEF